MSIIGILVAAIVAMALGALWYSPLLFGNKWMQAVGKTKETLGGEAMPMILSIVASLLTAIAVAILHEAIGVGSALQAAHIGLILGLLIIFPAFLSDYAFCGWSNTLLLIQSGYRIISILLMSLVIYFI
jgi:hypothetical protein